MADPIVRIWALWSHLYLCHVSLFISRCSWRVHSPAVCWTNELVTRHMWPVHFSLPGAHGEFTARSSHQLHYIHSEP